ncbi:hypothetical protein F511_18047 [Dorcoceras hygrometricum]|uniref:Uncharacterized protein n=1 Tax=Dorcoceras hygrometricum TaxID=472368 RepID=A0A2Z7BR63_9LAMI|nr:hypothetical protein F511_18047 [Dorcoceras hygrometricum]
MGNTDPNNKSRKRNTRSSLNQSINWQLISSLYTTHSQSAGGNHRSVIIGARQPITARRQTLVSDSHRSDDSVGLFGNDSRVGQSQRGTQSGYQIKSVNQAQDGTVDLTACEQISPNLKITRPKTSSNKSVQGTNHKKNKAQTTRKLTQKMETHGATYCPKLSSFALLSEFKTASEVGIKRKVVSRGFQRYQELEKRRSESTGNRDRK